MRTSFSAYAATTQAMSSATPTSAAQVAAPTSEAQVAGQQFKQSTQQRAFAFQQQIRSMQAEAFRNAQQAQQVYSTQVENSANALANLTNQAQQLAADGVQMNTAMAGLDENGKASLQQLQAQRQAVLINEATRIAAQVQANGVYSDQDVQQVEYARKLAEGLTAIGNQESAEAQSSAAQSFLMGLAADRTNYNTSLYNSSASASASASGGVTGTGSGGSFTVRRRYNPMFDDPNRGFIDRGGGFTQANGGGASKKELFTMLQTAKDPWEIYQLEQALANFDTTRQIADNQNQTQNALNQQANANADAVRRANLQANPYETDPDRQVRQVREQLAKDSLVTNPFFRTPSSSRPAPGALGRPAPSSFEQLQPGSTTGQPTSAEVLRSFTSQHTGGLRPVSTGGLPPMSTAGLRPTSTTGLRPSSALTGFISKARSTT